MRQSCSIAAQVFASVPPKSIKFVLIGFSVSSDVKEISQALVDYCKLCADNGAKPVGVLLPVAPAVKKTFDADVLMRFRQAVNVAGKNYKLVFIDLLNVKFAGAAAVSALLSERLYLHGVISAEKIYSMDRGYFDVLKKNFPDDYKNLVAHIFCRMASNDFKLLSKTMPADECKDLMAHAFSDMTYDHLAKLSDMLPKDDYNDVAARIFEISAEKLRRKRKIKVGFYFEHSSKWCGDELYNFFASAERFEPTVFFYVRGNQLSLKEFVKDLELFKSRSLNVAEIKGSNSDIPEQDVLIQLSPYDNTTPQAFRLINLKVTTLLAHIPYSYSVTYRRGFFNGFFFRVLWCMFFSSTISMEFTEKSCKVGMPRGIYSGYPKMDVFFKKDAEFKFDWKMTQPDAKKIIWAPHHSIKEHFNSFIKYATFQWNYRFMYEFAKSHPETSWIVKPHPLLYASAVREKVFPSIEALKEYLQAWDDLPNARVYVGAYYQAIFATSDGMIQDSASFIAEYQYVDKPMIYLTREGGKFNELGEEILKASYTVDGKDLDAIAAMMQRVFIEGDDYKAAERKEVFDKYLNYPKANGMLASEFIFKSIADEVTAPT